MLYNVKRLKDGAVVPLTCKPEDLHLFTGKGCGYKLIKEETDAVPSGVDGDEGSDNVVPASDSTDPEVDPE